MTNDQVSSDPHVTEPQAHAGHPLLGALFSLALLGLGAALFYWTEGYFGPSAWVAFYVLVALTTGTLFWSVCGATGTWSKPGSQLGGGAAIGMIFMLAANLMAPSQKVVAFQLNPSERGKYTQVHSNGCENLTAWLTENRAALVVSFFEGSSSGVVVIRKYLEDQRIEETRIKVWRSGKIKRNDPTTVKFSQTSQ